MKEVEWAGSEQQKDQDERSEQQKAAQLAAAFAGEGPETVAIVLGRVLPGHQQIPPLRFGMTTIASFRA